MPQIFKALASITVWILFILGCAGLVVPTVMSTLSGEFVMGPGGTPPPLHVIIMWAIAVACLALSVVCMKLRQMLE